MSFLKGIFGNNKTATFRHFAIGTFTLDVVTEEQFQKTWTKSESAVETGARVSDHRVINPNEIMIRGTVVNYEPSEYLADEFPVVAGLLDTIPLPIGITAVTDQVRAAVNKYGSSIKEVKRVVMATVMNDASATDDRITRIKKTLEQIADGDGLIEVLTSTGVYKSMQISGVSVTRSRSGDAEFQIILSEVLTYDVQIVGGIDAKIKATPTTQAQAQGQAAPPAKPTGEKKSERPATQSAKPQNKGKTTPQKSKKSALKTMIDSSRGFL